MPAPRNTAGTFLFVLVCALLDLGAGARLRRSLPLDETDLPLALGVAVGRPAKVVYPPGFSWSTGDDLVPLVFVLHGFGR